MITGITIIFLYNIQPILTHFSECKSAKAQQQVSLLSGPLALERGLRAPLSRAFRSEPNVFTSSICVCVWVSVAVFVAGRGSGGSST